MAVLAGVAADERAGRALLLERLSRGDGLAKFRELVQAQGGDLAVIDDPEQLPRAPVQRPVPAEVAGTVLAVDAEALGHAAMVLGAGRERIEDRIDAGAGLVIGRKVGDRVERGEAVAVGHTNEPARAGEGVGRGPGAYPIWTAGPARPPRVTA